MMARERSEADKAKVRTAAFLVIAAMLLWMGAALFGGAFGLPVRYAFLFDLAAMAAFAWAMFVLFRVWRSGAGGER